MKRVFKGHAYYTNDKDIVEFLKTQPLADFQAKGVTYSLVGIVQIMHNLSFDMALNKLKDEFAVKYLSVPFVLFRLLAMLLINMRQNRH